MRIGGVLVLLAAVVLCVPPAFAQGNRDVAKCPECSATLEASGWCEKCKAGYAAGLKTSCRSCIVAIHANGWCDGCNVGYADGQKTSCKGCLAAIQADGWCDDCNVGYAGGRKTSCKSCFAAMKAADGGWCEDCKVGYARGLKAKCPKCFAAIKTNGACEDCGTRFRDGHAFKRVALHVQWDEEQFGASEKVRKILSALEDVSGVTIDAASGDVMFELETTKGASVAAVIAALAKGGFEAHEGGH
jgi:hypothetical protein